MSELLLKCDLSLLNDRICNLSAGLATMPENGTMQVSKKFLEATLTYMEELLGMRRAQPKNAPTARKHNFCRSCGKDLNAPGVTFDGCCWAESEIAENKPLTRKNLYSMNDQRVWVQFSRFGMYALVAYHSDAIDGNEVYLTSNLGGRSTFEDVLKDGGTVYRYKPERSEG